MIANTQIYGKHFDADIGVIFNDGYASASSEFDKIAKIKTAPPGNHYTEAEVSPLGELRLVPEGTGVQFDTPEEGHEKTIYFKKYGLGFQITPEMYKDDLFRNFEKMPNKLSKSAAYNRETSFWDLFNTAFVTTYHTAWDAKALCADDRTTLKGAVTVGNEPASGAALSETTIQAAFEHFDTLKDQAGLKTIIPEMPYKLATDVANRWTVGKLYKQEFNLGSANRDLLTTNPENQMIEPWEPFLTRFMVDSNRWFLLPANHDFRFWWKEQATLTSWDDLYTDGAMFKVFMRYAAFLMDPSMLWGNPGS